mgnify:CR=1 FL=1
MNGIRKVLILTIFTALTLLSSFPTLYAAYGLWYTTGNVQCSFPDGSTVARVKVHLLKKQTSLVPPYGYFELLCSYSNSDTKTVTTTAKPTGWKIEWLFLVNGYEACRASTSGTGFPVTADNESCPQKATVTISAPTH